MLKSAALAPPATVGRRRRRGRGSGLHTPGPPSASRRIDVCFSLFEGEQAFAAAHSSPSCAGQCAQEGLRMPASAGYGEGARRSQVCVQRRASYTFKSDVVVQTSIHQKRHCPARGTQVTTSSAVYVLSKTTTSLVLLISRADKARAPRWRRNIVLMPGNMSISLARYPVRRAHAHHDFTPPPPLPPPPARERCAHCALAPPPRSHPATPPTPPPSPPAPPPPAPPAAPPRPAARGGTRSLAAPTGTRVADSRLPPLLLPPSPSRGGASSPPPSSPPLPSPKWAWSGSANRPHAPRGAPSPSSSSRTLAASGATRGCGGKGGGGSGRRGRPAKGGAGRVAREVASSRLVDSVEATGRVEVSGND